MFRLIDNQAADVHQRPPHNSLEEENFLLDAYSNAVVKAVEKVIFRKLLGQFIHVVCAQDLRKSQESLLLKIEGRNRYGKIIKKGTFCRSPLDDQS